MLQMKQTYSYNPQKHRFDIKQPIKKQSSHHILANTSNRHYKAKTSPNYIKQWDSSIKTPSTKTIKSNQSPKYKIIIASKSLSSKSTPRNNFQYRQDSPTNVRSQQTTPIMHQKNLSLHSRSLYRHTWKQVLDEQNYFVNKLQKLKRESKLSKLTQNSRSSFRYSTPPSIKPANKAKPQILQLKGRPLESYKIFICSKGQFQYSVGFNFNYLRNLSREQIQKYINFKDFGIVQSLQLCCLDVFSSIGQRIVQAENNLLREYCVLYFKQFQKNLMELVLLHHYFKIDQLNMFNFFLNCRIYFYALHEISLQYLALDNQYLPLLYSILKRLVTIQRLIVNGRKELLGEQKSQINTTLKLLRMTNQIQKLLPPFLQEIQQIIEKAHHIGKINNFLQQLPKQPTQLMPSNLFQSLIQNQVCLSWIFLSIPPIPHLPSPKKAFTLVLGIQGVLAHYDQELKYLILRPNIQYFFSKLQDQFEIVAFSGYQKAVADPIIDGIEKNQCHFNYRLYKEHLSLKDGSLEKDITKLGRQTECILLIDKDSTMPGVCKISKFSGNKKDKSLVTLADRLRVFIRQSFPDISTMGSFFCSLEDIMQENEENTNSLTVEVKDSYKYNQSQYETGR